MAAGDFIGTIRALLSPDNNLRGPAEKQFEEARKTQPAQTLAALFGSLAQAGVEEPVREQAAVLLRQSLAKIKDDGSTWSVLGAAGQEDSKAQTLTLFQAEQSAKVRRKLADVVQSLGNQLIDIEDNQRPNNMEAWPTLMPSLMTIIMDGSVSAGMRADALWCVKEMQCSIWQVMVANVSQTSQVIASCLAAADDDVRSNAAVLLCDMIDNIESREERAPFAPLIPAFFEVVKALAGSASNKYLNSVLESLNGGTECADFVKDQLHTLLPILQTVAKSHKEEDTQRLALEVMITFAENKPKMMAKAPGFIQCVLDVCVSFLMQLDDDQEAWNAADPEDDEEANFLAGKEIVDRLCRTMAKVEKFPQVMEVLQPALGALLGSGQWKQTVAATTILAQIAEYIDDDNVVTQMVPPILAQVRAEHPRVRHVAWSAVAQFSEDHAELMTGEVFAPQVLPLFVLGLDEKNNRVLQRCMESFQHFGESVERELLEPFVQPMMEKLGQLLQSSNLDVQKKSITYIAVIAGQMEDAFAPYYGPLMPLLKQLIQSVMHKTEERVLLGKLFECISLLAKAVGPEGFKEDAKVIMEAMIKATTIPDLPNNDPVKEYMMAASERIVATMKGEFLPFVPHILPGILEKFTLAPKEYNENSGFNEDDEVNLTLIEENGKVKVLLMSTSEMEDLKNALSCVHTFVEELGMHYAGFVAQTAQALLPVFDFSMGEEIRDLAFETWGQLCNSAREGGQGQILSQLVQEFLNRILPKLTEYTNLDVEALKTRADGVQNCLAKAGPGILTNEQVNQISGVAFATLAESFRRREEGKKGKKPKRATADDEDEAADDDDEDYEGLLRISCCEIFGALMKHHADAMVASQMQQILALVAQMFSTTDDTRLGLFVVCDMLEHLQTRITTFWPQFMPQLLQGIMHPSAELRQPACYGASLAAKDPAFAPAAAETMGKLAEVVASTRQRAKKKSEKPAQACADNALSAMLEILRNHKAALADKEAAMWGVWMSGLPCQEDEQEGQKNHKVLVEMVLAESPAILGDAGANLPQVVVVFVDIYKTEMADDDTSKAIGQLFLKLGESRLEQCAAQLSEKQRKKLMRIYREAQQGK